MRPTIPATLALLTLLIIPACRSIAQDAAAPATQQAIGRFPFLELDARKKQVRVECEALRCENALEFFLCATGTNEYESVLRSKVKPSHLHAALLALGLKPGEPVHFSETKHQWLPPQGPPLMISATFDDKSGKSITVPAWRLMRDLKTKREMPPMTFIFAGSRVMDDGVYAADKTGYLISVVNFDLTVIDIPKLASNANETLEWSANLDVLPAMGTKVVLTIEPAGKVEAPPAPATQAAAPIDEALITIDAAGKIALNGVAVESAKELPEALKKLDGNRRVRVAVAGTIEDTPAASEVINVLSAAGVRFKTVPQTAAASPAPAHAPAAAGEVHADDALIARLREQWEKSVAPHDASLREAAKTHYQVMSQLRAEQQRLIDEADKIQRLIDQLDKRYQDMTTPRPD
jgi:hypothetical protein